MFFNPCMSPNIGQICTRDEYQSKMNYSSETLSDKSTTVDMNPVFRWILAPNFSSLDSSTSMSCRRTDKRGEFGAKICLNSGCAQSSLDSSASSSYRCAVWQDEFGATICLNTGLIRRRFYPSQEDNYSS